MKKIVSVLLAVLLVIGAAPVQAVAAPVAEPAQPAAETETTVSPRATGEWITVPSIEGGQICFSNTGTITDCETSVTVANIPSEINGVAVTSIGESAFFGCGSLTSIIIPDSVTSIGNSAFQICRSLTSVTISDSVTSIGNGAFVSCDSLTSITIPDSVTSIGNSAFESCDSLTSIAIPDGVTSIGQEAFGSCSSLASITIPNSVTSIGDDAFSWCSSLNSAGPMGSGADYQFGWTAAIPSKAFSGCRGLTDIIIPDSVTSIGAWAFDGCSGLTDIYVEDENQAYASKDGVLFNRDFSSLLTYPAGKSGKYYLIPDSVTSIGREAFQICRSLTSITIPDSVTSIGDYAFYKCTSLTSIAIPASVTSIGNSAFYYCTSLTSITIPDGVTSIGGYAFYYCTSLTSITIPASVTSIGNGTFFGCDSLTSITIPDSVTSIGQEAFRSCDSLTSITIPASVTSIGYSAFSNCDSLTSITIPDSVTNIGGGAFEYCRGLTRITIPASVTSIGHWTFRGCSSLTSITIPKSVTSIDELAFSGCSSLTNITIPDSVNYIDDHAFEDCGNLTNVTILGGVMSIEYYTFYRCTGLTSIVIPESVTSIGESAFYSCDSLTDVYYSRGQEQWEKVRIGSKNTPLANATIHYNSTAEDMYIDQGRINVPKDKYRFHITDPNGKDLQGAKVTYDKQSGVTDKHGMVTFDSFTAGTPKITVTLDGYDTWTNENSNWQKSKSGYETIVLYPASLGKYKLAECRYSNSANFSDHNTNLLTSTKKVALKNTGNLIGDLDFGNFYLSCKSYSPGETEKYQLWQGEKMVAESANGQFSLSVEQFTKGGGCKIRVLSKDGKQVDTPINLEFAENKVNKSSGISLMKKGLGITVADDVPFLGGSTFNVGMEELLPVEIRATDEKWYFGFNAKIWPNDDKNQTKGKFEEFKKSLEKVKKANAVLGNRGSDLMNSLISMEPDFDLPGGKVKVKIIGYAEAEWGSTVATGEIYIQFKATTPTFGFTTWVVVVPVTVQVSGYIEAQAGVKTKIDLSNFTFSDTEFPLNITLGLNAFGGVGVGQVVGVGAYGDADVKFEMQLFLNQFLRAIDLTGELGLKAYVGPFEYSRAFAHHTWNLYKANNVKAAMLNAAAEETDDGGSMFDAVRYKLQDLSYLEEESRWLGNAVTLQEASASTALTPLLTDTYRNAQPKMISTGSGLYAAFLRADEATGEVYAAVTKYSGGSWKAPVRVDNTAVLDNAPALCEDGSGNIWLAYAKTAPDYDKNSLSDYAKKQSIVVGKIDPDTLTFTKMEEYPGAGYAHLQTLAVVNGAPTLAWVDSAVTDNNSVLWPQNNTIKVAQCTARTWGAAQALTTEPKCVSQITLGEKNSALAVAYTVDRDNNYNTTEDQSLYCWANSTASLLAENVQGKVKFAKLPGQTQADFLWNQDGTLRTANGVTVEAAGITGEYAVTGDRIYYSAAGESGAQLTTVSYENGAWSAPITITGGERYLENLSAATWNGNDFVLGMDTLATITTDNVEDAKDLVWAAIQPVSNLKLEEITYEAEGLTAGKETPVTLWVTNAGDHEVTSIDIVQGEVTQAKACQLQPGETGQLSVNLTCPSTVTEYSLTVNETGKEDYTPIDNTAAVSLGYADVAVDLSEQRIGTDWSLVAVVTNNGVAPASGGISFTNGVGESVGESYFENVEPGATVIATKKISKPGDYTAALTCEGEDLYTYNNSDTINVQRSTEIQLVEQQEDGLHATIYTEQPATAYCATYSDSGKMLGIQQAALSAGIQENVFTLNNPAVRRVKVFLLNENQQPQCPCAQFDLEG